MPTLLVAVPLSKSWLGLHYWKAPPLMELPVELEVTLKSSDNYPSSPHTTSNLRHKYRLVTKKTDACLKCMKARSMVMTE